jgi:glutathione peroxidase-family protein
MNKGESNMRNRRFSVVTVCGSTKFYKEYQEVIKQLTRDGSIVLSCPYYHHSEDKESWDSMSEEEKKDTEEKFTQMHYQRIDMSDAIMVINVDGYIGESTKKEIEYARKTGKGVLYYS